MLQEYKIEQSTADELYTKLFRLGEGFIQTQKESRNFKGNPMIYVNDGEKYDGKMRRYIGFEDTFLKQIHWAQKQPSNLINAISYYGRKKDKEHSDKCFGLIFDIDGIDGVTLYRFIYGCYCTPPVYPEPNFLVISKSGKGMHLYYLFDEPLRLFPKTKIYLKSLKYKMTRWLWNPLTSNDKKTQYQSYDQSFMIAGSKETMTVWRLKKEPYSTEELFEIANVEFDKEDIWIENKYTLEEAKEKFPQWYEKVIINGNTLKGQWTCKRDLYDWWLNQMLDPQTGATYGHRYWCTMMLVIYAVKCGVSFQEVKKQAYDLIPILNRIKPDKPFTKADVKSALECYDTQYATFPIKDISMLSGIHIETNKRNGRSQAVHIKTVNAMRKFRRDELGEDEYKNNGRPDKANVVFVWRKNNPKGKKMDCHRDTGLSRVTIDKWWNV